ncbi:MAG: serine/threonine-protein kinase, partial [Acidobacteriota bacterium]
MSPERWQKIRSILDDVSEATYGRRWEVLAHACGDDLELRQEVISFLDLDGDFDDFMESPLWTGGASAVTQTAAENAPTEDPIVGRRIGPYRLEKLLGRGGMGAVYLAVREDDYQQRAALKVVSWGTESEEIHARFYNERQILARLQHPGIARLLDGGTTDDGRPYLVMEYVEGLAIDRYCELHELSIRQRLELFREVCAAVQFAHQNLVIHRDLKATNILVTDDGHPRLLDFGIAKLLEPQLAAQQLATIPGKLMLTPAYASPEQLLDEQVTTASDVYALGVLLYGLLAGRLPFRVDERGYSELIQAICKRDPPKPSLVA